uniref:Vesicle-trafficking protein SEC22a n=1 Tax=Cacopsylla melanoneura TaxID=428564 RepID=A0A8D8LZZ0_9HEMI
MIHSAIILRTGDGLTLTSSADERNQDTIQEGHKKYLKLLAKNVKKLDNKCFINLGPSNLYFIKNLDIMTYIAIVDVRYPTTLSICFLKEIQNEFSGKYDARDIANMRRPYSCIEFNEDILKMIKRYNRPQSLTTRIDLQEINKELQGDPLKQLTLYDLEPKPVIHHTNHRKTSSSHAKPSDNLFAVGVGALSRLECLHWYHYIFLVLCFMTGLLSAFRWFEFDSTHDSDSSFPYIFALHSLSSFVQILFLVKAGYQGWKYYFHFNLLSSLFASYLMLPYTDDVLVIINLVVSVGMHVVTMTRSHVSKRPQSLV